MKPTIYKINGMWRLTFKTVPIVGLSPTKRVGNFTSQNAAFLELKLYYDNRLVYRDARVGR